MVVEMFNSLMVKTIEENIYSDIPISEKNLNLCHLQYVDDALLFYQPNLECLLNMKRVLRCFQIVLRLNTNFLKSSLLGVGNVEELKT
ncbi:Uncharacterized protein TCM_027627 [Theobroma cacao]|uniref:Reverse transcriptase domain-containing protein n=1 Tax=Theobroma cacao TaxID=3641 RepID=A0A061G8P4_THECC|nr:Uncharacterized protein TCM_027627 [Theobroma cacao]